MNSDPIVCPHGVDVRDCLDCGPDVDRGDEASDLAPRERFFGRPITPEEAHDELASYFAAEPTSGSRCDPESGS